MLKLVTAVRVGICPIWRCELQATWLLGWLLVYLLVFFDRLYHRSCDRLFVQEHLYISLLFFRVWLIKFLLYNRRIILFLCNRKISWVIWTWLIICVRYSWRLVQSISDILLLLASQYLLTLLPNRRTISMLSFLFSQFLFLGNLTLLIQPLLVKHRLFENSVLWCFTLGGWVILWSGSWRLISRWVSRLHLPNTFLIKPSYLGIKRHLTLFILVHLSHSRLLFIVECLISSVFSKWLKL